MTFPGMPKQAVGIEGAVPDRKSVLKNLMGLAALVLCSPVSAQSEAWQAYVDSWRRVSHSPLTLILPAAIPTAPHQAADELFLKLTRGWDLSLESLPPPEFARFRQARGWPEGPRWALLDREGRALAEGVALPTGATLRDHLLSLGLQPTWEALDQFLVLHPDNGFALQKRLMIAFRMSTARFRLLRSQGLGEGFTGATGNRWPAFRPATVTRPEASAGISREAVETLHRLNQLPDSWRTDRDMLTFWLSTMGTLDAAALQPEVTLLRETSLRVWQAHPHTGGAQVPEERSPGVEGVSRLWLACQAGSLRPPDLDGLARIQPSPGRLWPSSDLLQDISINAMERQQARELLGFLDHLPEMPPPEGAWADWLALRSAVAKWRMVALAELNRWPEALAALQETRRLGGVGWREWAASLKSIYGPMEPSARDSRPLPPKPLAAPADFLEVLELPPLEPLAPPPVPKPLRFLVWGKPIWAGGWAALRNSPELAPWGPEELRLEAPTEADTRRLEQVQVPVEGWAVFWGETDIVATGLDAPEPVRLALQLRAVAPARMLQLDAFLGKHPGQLDARRDRYDLVRARMPLPALEGRLLEDAAAAAIPVDFGPEAPWLSTPESWRFQARRVVPELAVALQRWPANRSLWQAWVAWSAFLPGPPSVLAFAEGLPVFGSRSSWKTLLPAVAHRAVAAEFRKSRRFEPMADWFQEPWLGIVAPPEEKPTELPTASEDEMAIHEGYLEALKALKQTTEAAEAERRWRQARSPAQAKKP